jgi:hypothetical protein
VCGAAFNANPAVRSGSKNSMTCAGASDDAQTSGCAMRSRISLSSLGESSRQAKFLQLLAIDHEAMGRVAPYQALQHHPRAGRGPRRSEASGGAGPPSRGVVRRTTSRIPSSFEVMSTSPVQYPGGQGHGRSNGGSSWW